MKDFKVGDKVTAVVSGQDAVKGTVKSYQRQYRQVVVKYESKFGFIDCTFHDSNVYHGHNVTVKVEGEELPDRLRTETVYIHSNLVDRLSPFPDGSFYYVFQLTADLAKQVREYLAGKGDTA